MYERLKAAALVNLGGPDVAEIIIDMASHSRKVLAGSKRVALTSGTGKSYFSFLGTQQSRPVNISLYSDRGREFDGLLQLFREGFVKCTTEDIVRATYSIAYSVFAAHDIHDVGRKASATFFEVLIGHICARAIGVLPRRKIQIPESGADLPTDYIFDPGPRSRKIHLPIKTSTRERAVQAWVHQLVLEKIFGAGQYLGILVVASETKRNSSTGEVIEICVPRQLQMFQSRVAEMTRLYYLDAPRAYLELASAYPRVEVKPFGQALAELRDLAHAR